VSSPGLGALSISLLSLPELSGPLSPCPSELSACAAILERCWKRHRLADGASHAASVYLAQALAWHRRGLHHAEGEAARVLAVKDDCKRCSLASILTTVPRTQLHVAVSARMVQSRYLQAVPSENGVALWHRLAVQQR
jgi:hypothetical protein